MLPFIIIVGGLILTTGLLVLLLPNKLWIYCTPKRSKLANQTSMAALLLFGGLLTIGIGLICLYGMDAYLGWRSTKWKEVEATVISNEIVEIRQVRSVNNAYRPQVDYSYTVDGIDYISNEFDFSTLSTVDKTWLEEQLNQHFPPGAKIIAYVNPSSPSQATLYTGIPEKALIMAAMGIAFLAIGSYYVRMLLRDWNGDATTKPTKIAYTHQGKKSVPANQSKSIKKDQMQKSRKKS